MLKGFKAVKERTEEQAAERAGWGTFIGYFGMKSGETALVRFNGTEDEPSIDDYHNVKRGQNFKTVQCARGVPRHAGCVACWLITPPRADPGVSRPSPKATFNVIDKRWYHKSKNAQKSQPGKDRFDYLSCSDDATCKLCKQKVPRERGGQKRWTISMTWANALSALHDKLRGKCASCEKGRIKISGYADEAGDPVEVDEWTEEAVATRLESGELVEELECSKCDNPMRGSLWNANIEVTRTGAGMTTSYQFDVADTDDPEEWEAKCEPADFSKILRPKSSEKQAEELGVANPFVNQNEASSYDKRPDGSYSGQSDPEDADPFDG